MGVTEDFEKFCKNIRMDDDTVETISNRCKRITQRFSNIMIQQRQPSIKVFRSRRNSKQS